MTPIPIEPYAKVAARLLQGPLYDDETTLWHQLDQHFADIYRHFASVGLELSRHERDGLAFLQQMELNEDRDTVGLVRRYSLTYEQSLLCVILREWLDEFDGSDAMSKQLYVTKKELVERIELFFREQPNKVRQLQQIDRLISTMVDSLGFLRPIKTDSADEERYEVRRIIKHKVTNNDLEDFLRALTRPTVHVPD